MDFMKYISRYLFIDIFVSLSFFFALRAEDTAQVTAIRLLIILVSAVCSILLYRAKDRFPMQTASEKRLYWVVLAGFPLYIVTILCLLLAGK